MGRLYFMADGDEMVRRRARIPKGFVVEAWADRRGGAAFWVGEDSRRLLDEAGERPVGLPPSPPHDPRPRLYWPPPCGLQSPPPAEAVPARVPSVRRLPPARVHPGPL